MRLTSMESARNSLKPFYFIGRRRASAQAAGNPVRVADVLLPDQWDEKQELRADAGGNGRKRGMRLIGR
jgi:hypothetical protein